MKQLMQKIVVAVLGVTVVGIVGCEWKGGSSDNSWNDSNSLANFNGTYTGNGGYLVSEYSLSSSSSSSGSSSGNVVGESGGTLSGGISFGGHTASSPILAGSLTIYLSGGDRGSFRDDGAGHLSGQYLNGVHFDAHGSIDYNNGSYSISADTPVPFMGGSDVTLNYTIASSSTNGSITGGSTPAGSGKPIYAFSVQQTGNKLKIIDNNGSVYEGSLGDVRTTGNLGSADQNATFVNGDQVSASFSASGTSDAGKHVNLVGTFQGTASGVSQVTTINNGVTTYRTSMALGNRTMTGTWIEDGGKTGNISGTCPSASQVSYATGVGTNRVNTSSF